MSLITLSIILAMFLMDTSMCIIDVNNAIREISYTLTSNSTMSLADRYNLTDNLPWPVENALYAYMVRTLVLSAALLNTMSPHSTVQPRRYYYNMAGICFLF